MNYFHEATFLFFGIFSILGVITLTLPDHNVVAMLALYYFHVVFLFTLVFLGPPWSTLRTLFYFISINKVGGTGWTDTS